MSEKSSNENRHFAENVGKSKHLFNAFSFDDLSVITGPKITILIYFKRTYYRLSRYICFVVLSALMYKCNLYYVL